VEKKKKSTLKKKQGRRKKGGHTTQKKKKNRKIVFLVGAEKWGLPKREGQPWPPPAGPPRRGKLKRWGAQKRGEKGGKIL